MSIANCSKCGKRNCDNTNRVTDNWAKDDGIEKIEIFYLCDSCYEEWKQIWCRKLGRDKSGLLIHNTFRKFLGAIEKELVVFI